MKDLPTSDVLQIPLDELYLHRFNPRQSATEEQIEAKAASMATSVGLMMNLLAYQEPGTEGYGIVGGGLRMRALQKLAAEGWARHADQTPIDPVSVRVTTDATTARAWALGENVSLDPLTPVQEMRAYKAMADETGVTAELIARAFGKTERHVARRLALANLPDPVLDALDAGQISLDVARTLTLARNEDQLAGAIRAATDEGYNAHMLRNMLEGESVTATDRRARYVGLTAYAQAGGTMTEDLFSDNHMLHDVDVLDELFHGKLTNAAERIKAEEGWAEVVPVYDCAWIDDRHTGQMERLFRIPVGLPDADFAELEQLEETPHDQLSDDDLARIRELNARQEGDFNDEDIECGTVFVYVRHSGELTISRAWRKKQKAARQEDGVTSTGGAEKPAIPASVAEDLRTVRLAALQGAMHDKTELALNLLAYQLVTNRPSYNGPFGIEISYPAIEPSDPDGTLINSKLTAIERSTGFGENCTWDGFTAFCQKGKKHRNAVLALHLTRALNGFTSNGFIAALEADLAPDIRKVWTPTADNFFKRVRADLLDQIWAELLELDDDDERRAEFVKLKKGDKARELGDLFSNSATQEAHGLSRAQIAAIDAWMPEVE